jgi:hypothetical protein
LITLSLLVEAAVAVIVVEEVRRGQGVGLAAVVQVGSELLHLFLL